MKLNGIYVIIFSGSLIKVDNISKRSHLQKK